MPSGQQNVCYFLTCAKVFCWGPQWNIHQGEKRANPMEAARKRLSPDPKNGRNTGFQWWLRLNSTCYVPGSVLSIIFVIAFHPHKNPASALSPFLQRGETEKLLKLLICWHVTCVLWLQSPCSWALLPESSAASSWPCCRPQPQTVSS